MKVKFNIMYQSGKIEVVDQELTDDQFANITKAINYSFREGESAVIRFGNDDEFSFINMKQVSRVKIDKV